jgi:EAL and modified HD-GYP domain-containing signal transduction protein
VAGAWYLQPPAKASAAQAASRARALKLMQLVNADADTREIETELRQDPALSYHLLRMVNSVALRGQREIGSFAQAIMILGRQQLRRWLHLMLFSARDEDPRSAMLTARVMLRARTMELAAEALGQDRAAQEQAFMAGLFSLLGVLFGQPLGEVLRSLALPDTLAGALLRGQGELGTLLARVDAAEAPPTHTAPTPAGADGSAELSPLRWAQLQLAALLWAGGGQEH